MGQESKSSKEILREQWQERLNTLIDNGLISEKAQSISLEDLEHLLDNPIDINKANAQDLRQIPFLTDFQIHQLIHHRTNRAGERLKLEDLKTIKSWDRATLLAVLPLLKSSENDSLAEKLNSPKEGKTKFNLLYSKEKRAEKEQYIGSPSALAVRFQYKKGNKINLFLGAEKNAYEPWRYQSHRGFDSYAYSLSLQNFLTMKKFVVGDFRISWAEGLCLNQGFRLMNYNTGGYMNRLSGISGLSEGRKFRGLAGQWRSGKLSLMAFASQRKLDGRIDNDGRIYNLSEMGLHRTAKDFERRKQVPLRTAGIQLSLELGKLNLSLHHLYYDFSKKYTLAKGTGASKIPELRDINNHYNSAISYSWYSRQGYVKLSGELARNKLGGIAYVQNSSMHFTNIGDVNLGFRYISPKYWAYHAQTKTHALRPNNEQGVRLAFTSRELLRNTELRTYLDLYKELKNFNNKTLQGGQTFGFTLNHKFSQRLNLEARLSIKKNTDELSRLRLGLRTKYQPNKSILFDTGISSSRANEQWGYLLYNKMYYQISNSIKLKTSVLYHDVANWSGRIYYYEPQLNYQYQPLFLYRKGYRLAMTLQGQISKHLYLSSKVSYHHFNHLSQNRTSFSLLLSIK